MRKRKGLIILLILILVIAGLWLWWRSPSSSLKKEAEKLKPELVVSAVSITDIDENKISGTSKIVIKNNLPIEVTTRKLNYTVYIDSAKVLDDTYSKPITIRSSDTTVVTLPMEIMAKKLEAVLKRLENNKADSAEYSIKASFEADVPVAGERSFTMNMSKRLPAIRLLKFALNNISIGDVGIKESSLDMTVSVKNPNVIPFKLKDVAFKFNIDKDENVMKGTVQDIINIPAKSTAPVVMHVDMKTMKVPKLGWKMLFDQKDVKFKMDMNCKIISEDSVFSDSKMVMTMQGTLAELSDLAK
jgi:LEA14-like dessication related protein